MTDIIADARGFVADSISFVMELGKSADPFEAFLYCFIIAVALTLSICATTAIIAKIVEIYRIFHDGAVIVVTKRIPRIQVHRVSQNIGNGPITSMNLNEGLTYITHKTQFLLNIDSSVT